MKSKSGNLSLHLARFRTVSRKLDRLVQTGRFAQLGKIAQVRLIARVRAMYEALRQVTGVRILKRALAGAAIVVGVAGAQQAQAQTVPNFSAAQTNPFSLLPDSSYNLPELVDLDGDGDLDIIANVGYFDVSIFPNLGTPTAPSFAGSLPLISVSPAGYSFVSAGDLDNDGDFDLIMGESAYGAIHYMENTGSPTNPSFPSFVTNPFGLDSTYYFSIPSLADMDNDGDLDLWVGEYYGTVQYFENVGTPSSPSFAAPIQNPFGITTTLEFFVPEAVDLDADGDIDLLVNDYTGDFQFFENIGTPTSPSFAPVVANPFNLALPGNNIGVSTTGDLDGDGDTDILTGYYYETFLYYENSPMVAVDGPIASALAEVFPNPVINQMWVSWETGNSMAQMVTVQVTDLQGKVLMQSGLPVTGGRLDGSVDVSQLAAGAYLVQLSYGLGGQQVQKFIKQ